MIALLDPIPAALLGAAFGTAFGTVLGYAHFATLRLNVRLYLAGGGPMRALALQVLRIALLAGGLGALAWLGAPALLGGMAGVLLARRVVLRRTESAA